MGRFIGTDKFEGALAGAGTGVFTGDDFSQIYNLDSINEYISSDLIGLSEFIYILGYHNLTLADTNTPQKDHPWQPDSYSWPSSITSYAEWAQLFLTTKKLNIKQIYLTGPSGYLTEDGQLWLSGSNSSGQLGQNDTTTRSSPVQVDGNWTDFECRSGECFGVKSDGTLWSWGTDAGIGVLGHGVANVDRSSPTQIGSDTDWDSVYHGYSGSYVGALKTTGALYTWGNGGLGPLGNGGTSRSSPTQVAGTWTSFGFKADESAYGIKSGGTLWSWGRNTGGSTGDSTNSVVSSSPIQIGALTNWAYVNHYSQLPFAVKTDGTLWSWGSAGGTGDNTNIARSSPVQTLLPFLMDHTRSGKNQQQLAYQTTGMAVANTGQLMAWGSQSSRRMGYDSYKATENDSTVRSHPIQIGYEDDWNDRYIMAGGYQTFSKATPLGSQNFHDKAVALRMTFDGSNGATSATDFSGFAHSATFNGNAQLATGEKQFGTASLSLDGSGDYLSIDGANFSPGKLPWMAECWFYPNALPAGDPEYLLNAWTNGSSWNIVLRSDGQIQVDTTGSQILTSGASISTGAWNHVRIWSQGVGSRVLIMVNRTFCHNGVTQASELNALTGDFLIGGTTSGQFWDGYIDDVRIAIGGVLPYENITSQPTEALPTS